MDYASKYLHQIVTIAIDRPAGSRHPQFKDLVYPCNYGFIPGTKAPDGEPVDAYVLGIQEPLKEFTGRCIAVVHRTDDEDDKLVVVANNTTYTDEQIIEFTKFQERFHTVKIIREL
jgi:inorganic pyrophosphatase